MRGKWGFDDWEGPRFHLRASLPGKWSVAAADQSALVVGREDTLHIEGENALCVERIEEQADGTGTPLKLAWKSPKPEQLEVVVPMKDAAPGPVNLQIYQFGLEKPDLLADGGLRRGRRAGPHDPERGRHRGAAERQPPG